ncbi:MAG: GGDEF domain-containing protein [Clostridiales bacterium]|nr:GGDEF domain-containing protein [Clostridiales bacterium]
MYTREQLERFPYFAERLGENDDVSGMLDQLTGLVSRGHILWFAQWLIEREIPFSFAMMDLDNFKFVNDTYGHHVGDEVLIHVADDLAAYLGEKGVAGRFGGDEMLIVNLEDVTYDAAKALFIGMYDGKVLRKNIRLEDCNPFITATVGCACFPKDAQDYNHLFELIDKTLYRGKSKGRNCHIIYVEEKHKDIQIRQIAKHGMYTTFSGIVRQYEFAPGLVNKLRGVMPLLMEELQITDLYYVGSKGIMRSVRNTMPDVPVSGLDKLLRSDDLYSNNTLADVEKRSPAFYEVLKAREVETLCVVRIGMDMQTFGYLICAEARNRRIWQEAECAILFFLTKMIAGTILINGEELE